MKNFTNFTFHMTTEIVFGKDTELQTADLVKKYGGTKVLIVTDAGDFIKKSGLFDKAVATLDAAGIPYVELPGVQPNPRRSLVYKGIELAKAEKVDFLFAIGGGSTLDTAKAIGIGMEYDGDFWDFYDGKAEPEKTMPLGVIITMAATGSETSTSSVILDDIDSHTKTGSRPPRPVFAIMNPEITYTLPPFQTGAGAADILAHAFDSYFTYGDSYLGDKFSESAMCAAVKYGPLALKNPTDYEARAELMLTSSFSHNDTCRIGRQRLPMSGGGHNLERNLSGFYDTAHGAGLAVMMPALLQYLLENDETTVDKIAQFGNRVFAVEADAKNPKEVAQEGVKRFRAWMTELGMPATISELIGKELTDEEIDKLVGAVRYNPEGLMIGFGHLTRDDVRKMYESVR
jgi:alcohol dehydrogenase YqhD (iron-dependent ADH family)